jgi:PiT family inorganic phosphate transporter
MIGMGVAFLFMAITLNLLKHKPPRRIDKWYRRLQLVSASAFSFGHGTNDAQKTMGIIMALLFSVGYFGSKTAEDINELPAWIILSCHAAIALGTLIGGFKVVKTMGQKLTKLRPVHGFAAESSGAMTVIGCSLIGIPVSTTHTITGSIMGVGATRRMTAIKWGVARRIIWAWIITIPFAALVAAASFFLVEFVTGILF